ncbi:unnamed protein product [Caenorhabditis auriculariae]|uniref:Nucleotide-diphospho-sugar transferase domain-containing protein n=1 Tax=Caenorhabditis auriculariae TaxID=2777116 RepID=A0A8S1H663_9PELO|nr:unnamed protein product [Caenorhabditis auriculariae]
MRYRFLQRCSKTSYIAAAVTLLVFCYLKFGLNGPDLGSDNEDDPSINFPIARVEATRSLNVAIVIIVGDIQKARHDYRVAINTLECYAAMHNYPLKILSTESFSEVCSQKDFMFRRHCVVAEVLKESEWVLFIDADSAVVNPEILIEQYIDPRYDITLYDRFVNWEIAAGSYIVRNTPWAINFLKEFADFEKKLPESFHGTDNGAVHAFLQQNFMPSLKEHARVCMRIWENSQSFKTLFLYEACIRSVMGDVRDLGKVRILEKGRGWLRDVWLADSQWSAERDFILHGLKEENLVKNSNIFRNILIPQFSWRNPLKENLNINECARRTQIWPYEESLRVSREIVEDHMRKRFVQVEKDRWNTLSNVARFI